MKNIPIRRTDTEKVQVGDYFDKVDRYYDQVHEITVVKVFSGDCHVTIEDEMLVTILGSCISACIRDPVAGVGGMNHFLLPGNDERMDSESLRFGAFAMEQLLNQIMKLGGDKKRLEVKLFGGANVIESSALIGSKNVDFVREFLRDEGIKITKQDVGGDSPRRIHYYPKTGKVMMRKLKRKDDMRIIEEEKQYAENLHKQKAAKNVELF